MTYCHVSRQIADHAHGEMVFDSFHQALNRRIEELTEKGAKYYPFERNNCMEALAFLPEPNELILVHALENGIDNIGLLLGQWVTNFWTLQAEKTAIEELSK